MSINTKLVLLLTLAVGAVLLSAGFLSLRQREAALKAALSDELRAHAVTLQIALEENFANGEFKDVQRLIDRLRKNSPVYGVMIYDERRRLLADSQTEVEKIFGNPPELEAVLEKKETVEFVRTVNGDGFLCLLLPLQLDADRTGALEIVKPLALIERDIAQARLNSLTTALFLLAIIFLIVYIVTQRSIVRPIRALLDGAGALARGNLEHRVHVSPTKDELARLAAEFNRMADHLERQRQTARNEAENRLKLEKELRHKESLATVGRLAAGVAHELGAPLNVIDARAEQILAREEMPPDKRARNLQIIRSQTRRITHLVRQLLDLARPFNLRLTLISLNDLLKTALEPFEQENLKIEFSGEKTLFIKADRDFLTQVFTNIFRNAVQAMPDGGKLHIICENENGTAIVRISDTGDGIAPENLEKIFDPFYTTKDIGQGTGLGLAVSRRIVEEHGGTIRIVNNAEKGVAATITLPQNFEV